MLELEDGIYFVETEAQRDAVYALRYDIYVREMGRYHDVADHARGHLREAADAHGRLFLMIAGGAPAATWRINWGGDPGALTPELRALYDIDTFRDLLEDRQMVVGERLMVRSDLRGSDLGLRALLEVGRFLIAHDVEVMFCDCEPHLLNSYLQMGMQIYTHVKNYPGIGFVVPLALVPGDHAHLERVRSPYWPIFHGATGTSPDLLAALRERVTNPSAVLSEQHVSSERFMVEIGEAIARHPRTTPAFLDGLSSGEISLLVAKSHIFECGAGQRLILDGGAARSLFVVLSGVVEIHKDERLLGVAAPGDVLGEFAFLLGMPRSADVIASTDARVLTLSEGNLLRIQSSHPEVAAKLMLNLSRCLCQKLIDLRQTVLSAG